MTTLPPETTRRCVSPVAWKSRSVAGSSSDPSPRASPSSRPASRGGKARWIDPPMTRRVVCVARTNGLGEPPSRSNVLARTATAIPRRCNVSAKACVLGELRGPGDADEVTSGARRRRAVATRPDGLAERCGSIVQDDTRDVEEDAPAEGALQRVLPQGPRELDLPRDHPRQVGGVPAVLGHAVPADPAEEHPGQNEPQGGQRPTRGVGAGAATAATAPVSGACRKPAAPSGSPRRNPARRSTPPRATRPRPPAMPTRGTAAAGRGERPIRASRPRRRPRRPGAPTRPRGDLRPSPGRGSPPGWTARCRAPPRADRRR